LKKGKTAWVKDNLLCRGSYWVLAKLMIVYKKQHIAHVHFDIVEALQGTAFRPFCPFAVGARKRRAVFTLAKEGREKKVCRKGVN
jgi:hypothetical protein